MKLNIDNNFWYDKNDSQSKVFEIYPNIFSDTRGGFSQSLTYLDYKDDFFWIHKLDWIKQINRSYSIPYVFRGMHAQQGINCQAKLVECLYGLIFDVIIDVRPQSETFGKIGVYLLSSKKQNKLFCPKGFLHGFLSCLYDEDENIITKNHFQYFCDSVYDQKSEIGVNPKSILDQIPSNIKEEDIEIYSKNFSKMNMFILNKKDENYIHFDDFTEKIKMNFLKTKNDWYK